MFESLAAYDVVGSSLSMTLGATPEIGQSSRVSAVVYVAVIFLLSLIAVIATLGPAMRATRIDLTTVLRQ